MPTNYCVILTTAGSQAEADRLAELLVTRGLAACVQMLPMTSCYMWKGQVTRDAEMLLLIKTSAALYRDVEAALVKEHGYEVPEIVQVPIERGLDRYLDWIGANTQ